MIEVENEIRHIKVSPTDESEDHYESGITRAYSLPNSTPDTSRSCSSDMCKSKTLSYSSENESESSKKKKRYKLKNKNNEIKVQSIAWDSSTYIPFYKRLNVLSYSSNMVSDLKHQKIKNRYTLDKRQSDSQLFQKNLNEENKRLYKTVKEIKRGDRRIKKEDPVFFKPYEKWWKAKQELEQETKQESVPEQEIKPEINPETEAEPIVEPEPPPKPKEVVIVNDEHFRQVRIPVMFIGDYLKKIDIKKLEKKRGETYLAYDETEDDKNENNEEDVFRISNLDNHKEEDSSDESDAESSSDESDDNSDEEYNEDEKSDNESGKEELD